MPPTIPINVMIISDTHDHIYDGSNMPHTEKIDVLIHTGDLTNFGEPKQLRESIKMLASFSAPLKLVIAGNHDIFLDKKNRVENLPDAEYAQHHKEAVKIMTGPTAQAAGVTYLEEGTHTFTVNGATLTVYASPYTPGSGGGAFAYSASEDPFSGVGARHPMPKHADIVMTHGPPASILDQVDGQNLGCPKLLRAAGRTRPLLHGFGHIHEGHGANLVTWKPDGTPKDAGSATPLETEQINEYPYANEWSIKPQQQTLMVNAAMMRNAAKGMRPDYNKPFIVTINLPLP